MVGNAGVFAVFQHGLEKVTGRQKEVKRHFTPEKLAEAIDEIQ